MSRWLGEGARLVKRLFKLARAKQPAVIFIDDIDSLCGARSDYGHDEAQRLKTEFMVQMEEVGVNNDGIVVIGATTIPWRLDTAIRRRFEKRIYIPLPEEISRRRMFELSIGNIPCDLKSQDLDQLAKMTEGYSGADIKKMVGEAMRLSLCKIQRATHYKKVQGPNPSDPSQVVDDLYMPCSAQCTGAIQMTWEDIPGDRVVEPSLTLWEFMESMEHTRPTVTQSDLERFDNFTEKFGRAG